ncbi:putative cyclase [Vulcanisaeta moutnovskia 768-28]|uniref:Cyclase n=1 Tax=Vulcanisaeta moutnovskia (strain 768-28) TaxID=985053 RepID=F0QUB1_VULM7|nr:cyclase family protein [Vulcanisaeta moutnovskia]ADY00651.1 putative cyclase [Vulcanisaeta moutnovskia 768-28]
MSQTLKELINQLMSKKLILIDLTHELYNGMPTYPGDPPFMHEYIKVGRSYGESTLSKISAGLHSGTHIDLPRHFVPNGLTAESLPLMDFMTYGVVLDLSYKRYGEAITVDDLRRFDDKIKRNYAVMLYTGFSKAWGTEEFLYNWPYLDRSGADYLVSKEIRVVGIEALSIAGWPGKEGYPYPPRVPKDDVAYVHYKLLSNGIYIIEGVTNLDSALSTCKNGEGLFIFMPLKIRGAEGSPLRLIMVCEPR